MILFIYICCLFHNFIYLIQTRDLTKDICRLTSIIKTLTFCMFNEYLERQGLSFINQVSNLTYFSFHCLTVVRQKEKQMFLSLVYVSTLLSTNYAIAKMINVVANKTANFPWNRVVRQVAF